MRNEQTILEIIDDINKDLVDPQIIVSISENDPNHVHLHCTEPDLFLNRQPKDYPTHVSFNGHNIENVKNMIISNLYYGAPAKTYEEGLRLAKQFITKSRNIKKAIKYLNDRYGISFHHYANGYVGDYRPPADNWMCNVVYPDTPVRFMPIFNFCHFFCLYFDGTEVSQKSLNSYCRKMDKIITRLKCVRAAFGDNEISINGRNFYHLVKIMRSKRTKEWIIKFPYSLKRIWGSDPAMAQKLINVFRYKETDYCIWKATTPEEFKTMRDLIQ